MLQRRQVQSRITNVPECKNEKEASVQLYAGCCFVCGSLALTSPRCAQRVRCSVERPPLAANDGAEELLHADEPLVLRLATLTYFDVLAD